MEITYVSRQGSGPRPGHRATVLIVWLSISRNPVIFTGSIASIAPLHNYPQIFGLKSTTSSAVCVIPTTLDSFSTSFTETRDWSSFHGELLQNLRNYALTSPIQYAERIKTRYVILPMSVLRQSKTVYFRPLFLRGVLALADSIYIFLVTVMFGRIIKERGYNWN